MSAKEAQSRIKINKLLEEVGWRFFDSADGKANIFLEHRTKKGKISGDALGNDLENAPDGFVDYLLLNEQSRPVALVEAKRENIDPLTAKKQAREYSLSFDKYAGGSDVAINAVHEMVLLGDVCSFEYGKPLKEENRVSGVYPVYGSNGVVGYHNDFLVEAPFIVVGRKGSAGSVHFSERNGFPIDTTFFIKLANEDSILLKYLYHMLQQLNLKDLNTQAGVPGLNRNDAYQLQIPLPPLEIQKKIVTEIEVYQRVMDGCNLIVENYKPDIQINPEWQLVELGTICNIKSGGTPSRNNPEYWNGDIPWVTTTLINFGPITEANEFITKEGLQNSSTRIIPSGTLLMAMYGQGITRGKVGLLHIDAAINQACAAFFLKNESISTGFLYRILQSRYLHLREISDARGGNQSNLSAEILKNYQIPLPPLETQQKIVAELEEDLAAVAGAKRLKAKMEANIRATIGRVWGGEA